MTSPAASPAPPIARPARPLRDQRILVTGGTQGTGRAVVRALARAGARVVTCSRHDDDAARSLRAELASAEPGSAGQPLVLRADVTDPEQTAALVRACQDQFGQLDGLVHTVGAMGQAPFGQLPPAEWHRVADANLTSSFLVIKEAMPVLADGASVLIIGSRAAAAGTPQRAHYTAAKGALSGLTRSLARELGPRGIRVNLMAPAIIDKEETAQQLGPMLAKFASLTALRRLAVPADLADVAMFLVSNQSRYITGQTIVVDGGL
jgi:3-oxoacyl-[acyl-carrier protein] reductase